MNEQQQIRFGRYIRERREKLKGNHGLRTMEKASGISFTRVRSIELAEGGACTVPELYGLAKAFKTEPWALLKAFEAAEKR